MDKVIILMATWQGEKFLQEQIDSILAQDYINLQLIVQDDASKDSTLKILSSYAERFPDKVIVYENIKTFFIFFLCQKQKIKISTCTICFLTRMISGIQTK